MVKAQKLDQLKNNTLLFSWKNIEINSRTVLNIDHCRSIKCANERKILTINQIIKKTYFHLNFLVGSIRAEQVEQAFRDELKFPEFHFLLLEESWSFHSSLI